MSGIKLPVNTNAVTKHPEGEKQVPDAYLADTHIIHTNNFICETAAQLRQAVRLKLPDALIAATGLFLDIPLLSFDSDFEKYPI